MIARRAFSKTKITMKLYFSSLNPILSSTGSFHPPSEMRLRKVYTRGLSLGALFMQGVEMASFANDACGSPIPWQLTCPWEFFDGKIFHLKLIKALWAEMGQKRRESVSGPRLRVAIPCPVYWSKQGWPPAGYYYH
jgi:hypothetical protein